MKRTSVRVVAAGVFGAIIGSIVTLMFASDDNKKSREKIVKAAKNLKRKR